MPKIPKRYYVQMENQGDIMSGYELYRQITQIESLISEPAIDVNGKDITKELLYNEFKGSFENIMDMVKYNKQLPYFNLKENWELIKQTNYQQVLKNLKEYLSSIDGRYDGENWNE